MADPFSVAGSAVGVVALGIKLCEDFVAFTGHVKDGKDEALKMLARLDMLEDHLEKLQTIVTEVESSNGGASNHPDLGITALAKALDELRRKLPKPKQKNGDSSLLQRFRYCRKRLAYPFKREELLFLKDLVQDLQQNLILALQALQLAQQQHNHRDTRNYLIHLSEQMRADALSIRDDVLNFQSAVVDTVKSALVPVSTEREMMMTCLTTIAASVSKLETRLTDTTPAAYSPTNLKRNSLQLNQLHQSVSGDLSPISRLRPFTNSSRPRCPTCISVTKSTKKTWEWGLISLTHESRELHSEECCHASYSKAHTSLELRLHICSYLLRRKIEVAFRTWCQNGISTFAPTFRISRVVPNDAPAFRLLRDFRNSRSLCSVQFCIQELRRLFSTHQAFPNDRLSDGQNLLHVLGWSVFRSYQFLYQPSPDTVYTALTVLVPFLLGAMGTESFTEFDCKGRSGLQLCTQLETPSRYLWVVPVHHHSHSLSFNKNIEAYQAGLNSLIQYEILETKETQTDLMTAVLTKSASELKILVTRYSTINDRDPSWKIHLSLIGTASWLGWKEGCEILLCSYSCPDHINRSIYVDLLRNAVFSGDPGIAQLFLRQRRKSGQRSSLKFHDLETAIHVRREYQNVAPVIVRLCQSELIKHRRRLDQMTRKYLHSYKYSAKDGRVLDAGARNALKALARRGIKVKHYLHPVQASIYHTDTSFDEPTFERLYIAGFRDVQATNFRRYPNVVSPVLWQSFRRSISKDKKRFDFCRWLISKGAKLTETWSLLPRMAAWKTLSYRAGEKVMNSLQFKELTREATDFVLSLLAVESEDDCFCPCSANGCSAISLFFQASLQSFLLKLSMSRQILFILTSWIAPVVRKNRHLATAVFRAITFWKLGLNHTCCNVDLLLGQMEPLWNPRFGWYLNPSGRAQIDLYNRRIKNQQEGIRKEDKFLRGYLEDLMHVIQDEFDASGQDVVEFVMGFWSTKMIEILQDLTFSDHETYHVGREQLGVMLHIPDLSADGLVGTVHLDDQIRLDWPWKKRRIRYCIPRIQTLDERTWVMPPQDSDGEKSDSEDDFSEESVYSDDDADPETAFWRGFDEEASSDGLSSDDLSDDSDSDSNENNNEESDNESDIFVDAES